MRKFWPLLLLPCVAYAGIMTIYQDFGTQGSAAYVQSKSCSSSATSNACAFNSNITAGNMIIVGCIVRVGTDTMGISDSKGNVYSAVGTSISGNSPVTRTNVFYAKNVVAGATTVTCTDTSGLATWVQQSIHEYSGIDTSSPLDVTSSSAPVATASTTTIVTGNATTTAVNDLMFAFASQINSAVLNQNGTLRENYVNNVYMTSQDAIIASASVYQSSWTIASGPTSFMAIQAAFKLPKGRGTISSQ